MHRWRRSLQPIRGLSLTGQPDDVLGTEVVIITAAGRQLAVCTFVNDAAAIDDDDPIRMFERGGSIRDDHGGPAFPRGP